MGQIWRFLRNFKASLAVLLIGLLLVWRAAGAAQVMAVIILAILEISLSFDNAVIDATVLKRMNRFWQRIYLTVGMVISVVGMRLLIPIAIVMVTAHLNFKTVVDLALNHQGEYSARLANAHPAIAAFGCVFFLMLFLDFVLDNNKQVHWINLIEQPAAAAGKLKLLPITGGIIAIFLGAVWAKNDFWTVLASGSFGLILYLLVRTTSRVIEVLSGISEEQKVKSAVGLGAFGLFCYLEVLDASFSFDGVIGAFAITGNIIIIMIGLAIGAMFIRELTVWMVHHDSLGKLIYIEHGAYYAIGVLAVILGISLRYSVSEVGIALVGVVFFAASMVSSLRARKTA